MFDDLEFEISVLWMLLIYYYVVGDCVIVCWIGKWFDMFVIECGEVGV